MCIKQRYACYFCERQTKTLESSSDASPRNNKDSKTAVKVAKFISAHVSPNKKCLLNFCFVKFTDLNGFYLDLLRERDTK